MSKKILLPLPSKDFDPTEVGVSFYYLKQNGFEIIVATPDGLPAKADELMATGKRLGILKNILMADKYGLSAYQFMINSSEFLNPIKYININPIDYDGMVLAGGHDKGMREYLESKILQSKIAEFFLLKRPIGAICHGVVLLSRVEINHESIIKNFQVTALTRVQELTAYNLTRLWLKDYYLTYDITVEDEVKSKLQKPEQFTHGPKANSYLFLPFLKRDNPNDLSPGFIVVDKNIITARWPGDAHQFISKFIKMIN